jgi:hypothetical protein
MSREDLSRMNVRHHGCIAELRKRHYISSLHGGAR